MLLVNTEGEGRHVLRKCTASSPNTKHNCLANPAEVEQTSSSNFIIPFKLFLNLNSLSQKVFQVCRAEMYSFKSAGISSEYMLLCLANQCSEDYDDKVNMCSTVHPVHTVHILFLFMATILHKMLITTCFVYRLSGLYGYCS